MRRIATVAAVLSCVVVALVESSPGRVEKQPAYSAGCSGCGDLPRETHQPRRSPVTLGIRGYWLLPLPEFWLLLLSLPEFWLPVLPEP